MSNHTTATRRTAAAQHARVRGAQRSAARWAWVAGSTGSLGSLLLINWLAFQPPTWMATTAATLLAGSTGAMVLHIHRRREAELVHTDANPQPTVGKGSHVHA